MLREMQHRLEKFVSQFFPIPSERFHEAAVCVSIPLQTFGRKIDIAIQTRSPAVIERMGERNIGMNPFKPELSQWERFEKWRAGGEWMNGRANVVHKPRQRQLRRARTAADGRVGLEDEDAAAGLR
jgi:hypothetical protein